MGPTGIERSFSQDDEAGARPPPSGGVTVVAATVGVLDVFLCDDAARPALRVFIRPGDTEDLDDSVEALEHLAAIETLMTGAGARYHAWVVARKARGGNFRLCQRVPRPDTVVVGVFRVLYGVRDPVT